MSTTTANPTVSTADSPDELPPEVADLIARHLGAALADAWRRDQEAAATTDRDVTAPASSLEPDPE